MNDHHGRCREPAPDPLGVEQVKVEVERLIRDRAREGPLTVLEAGCGSATHVAIPDDSYVIGIDISERQLDRNYALAERILGDLETYPLDVGRFDLVVCWDVLEHLAAPDRALVNMTRALGATGLLVLKVPNVMSLKGIITKTTPQWFHVFVYRNILDYQLAGTDGHPPFRTVMPWSIAPARIRATVEAAGLSVELLAGYAGDRWDGFRERHPGIWRAYDSTGRLLQAATGGRLRRKETEIVLVASAPP